MELILEAEKIAQRVVDVLVTEVCFRSDMNRLHQLHEKQHPEPDFKDEDLEGTETEITNTHEEFPSNEVTHSYWRQRRRSAELMRIVLAADCSASQNIHKNDDVANIKEEFALAGHGVERHSTEEGSNQKIKDMVVVPLDADLSFLKQLAHSEDTPVQVLEQLVKTCNIEIREALVDHNNVTIELLMILARDESCDVRYALAENHNIPKEVLEVLTADDNPYVQHRAQRTLNRINVGIKPAQIVQPQFNRHVRPLSKVADV